MDKYHIAVLIIFAIMILLVIYASKKKRTRCPLCGAETIGRKKTTGLPRGNLRLYDFKCPNCGHRWWDYM